MPSPSSIETELKLATEAYRSGNLSAAGVRVDNLLKSHPGRADVQLARGIIQIGRGDLVGGLDSLISSLQIEPHNAEGLGWAAYTALNLQRFEMAEGFARTFTDVAPQNPRAHYLLANALRALGRIEEALQAIDRSIDLKPDDSESLVTKARLLQSWQMPALATEIYKQAMAIRPTPAAGMELAKMQLRDSHYEPAIELLMQVSPLMQESIRPYGTIAEAYTLLHQFDDAERYWSLAKAQSVNPIAMAQGRARVEIAAGRFEVAQQLLFELIGRGQDIANTFSILSTGRKMKADDLPLIERMVDLSAAESNPSRLIDLSYALGKCFDDLRDFERAIAHFDAANKACLDLYGQRRAFDRDQSRAFTDFLIEMSSSEKIVSMTASGLETSLPLFVVGMMRSGTTLTESILSAHSRVKGGGEQAFWTERVIEFITPGSDGPKYNHELVMQFAKDYLELVDAKDVGILHVVDKNPANIELAAILHCVFPNGKFVHLMRHPVDNLLSIWMTPMSANVRFASDRSNLVFTYREHIRLVKHFQEVLPVDRFATFRYEDLTAEPQSTIGSMLEFLDLEAEEACFSPETNARSVLTPSVYQVRQPIHRGSQARWKNYEPWLGSFAELLDEA